MNNIQSHHVSDHVLGRSLRAYALSDIPSNAEEIPLLHPALESRRGRSLGHVKPGRQWLMFTHLHQGTGSRHYPLF